MTRILLKTLATCSLGTALLISAAPSARPKAPMADDSERSKAAFRSVAEVLKSPRCLNCHVIGGRPKQGDDRHFHLQHVVRGLDGQGLPGFRCTNCHGKTNSRVPEGPPGAIAWEMPRADLPMAWEGLSVDDLCRSIKNPALNGNRKPADLIDHMKTPLVLWAWEPGGRRTKPPLSYDRFMSSFREWVATGASCEN